MKTATTKKDKNDIKRSNKKFKKMKTTSAKKRHKNDTKKI